MSETSDLLTEAIEILEKALSKTEKTPVKSLADDPAPRSDGQERTHNDQQSANK